MKITRQELTALFSDIVRANLSLRQYYYSGEGFTAFFSVENILKYWMVEYVYSGASGGSCWGTSATPFYNTSEESIDEIQGDLDYKLRHHIAAFSEIAKSRNQRNATSDAVLAFSELIARKMVDHYEDGRSDWEYYGNGREYHIGLCEFTELLDAFKTHWSLEEDFSFEDLMAAVKSEVQTDITEYANAERKKEIKKYADLISSINTRKAAEKQNLEASLEAHKKSIEAAEKSIANIDKKYAKELKSLQARYEELTQDSAQ